MIGLEPLGDRVIVEPDPAAEQTAGGIILPEQGRELPQSGTVVAVGPGMGAVKLQVKVGDKVLYPKFGFTELTLDDKKYLMFREMDMIGILKPKNVKQKAKPAEA